MRKGLLFSALALGMGLFSCTQEDLTNRSAAAGGPVTVSVGLPEGSSRSVPTAPEGYDLRCVLQVVYGDGNETLTLTEKAGDAGANISFTFQPKSNDYTCLFWADYVDEKDNVEDLTDKFYTTEDLTNIGYVEAALTNGSLFNDDACDAFCGKKDAQSIVDAGNKVNVTLTRPFMKMSIVDGTSVSGDQLDVTVANMPSGYNVLTGASEGNTVTMSMTDTDLSDNTDNVWFSNYMFAPSNVGSFEASNITMAVTTDGEKVEKTLQGTINVGPNTTYNGNVNFDLGQVDIEVGIEEGAMPKVGDYYYSDGTFSSALADDKTVIGVIFATSDEIKGDVPANYADIAFEKDYIRGWVVALNNLSSNPRFVSASDGGTTATLNTATGVGTGPDDIKGYANCQAWRENPLLNGAQYTALDRVESYEVEAPKGTSGWYIASLGQILVLREAYIAEDSKVKSSLQALTDGGKASMLTEGTGGSTYYWTSTAGSSEDDNIEVGVYRASTSSQVTSATPYIVRTGTDGNPVRPILTF